MRHLFVFVGPYAVWCFPWKEWVAQLRSPPVERLSDEVFDGGVFSWAGAEWGSVERDGRTYQRYFAVPREHRHGAPERPMLLTMDHMGNGYLMPFTLPTEWTGIDREAEVRWFQSIYAAELSRASEFFGVGPEFHWGLVVEQD